MAGLSNKELSYNSVEISQISCFLMAAEQGFGPGKVGCYGTLPGPLYSSSLDIVYNPIPVIAIATRYNICDVSHCLNFGETYWKLNMSLLFVQ